MKNRLLSTAFVLITSSLFLAAPAAGQVQLSNQRKLTQLEQARRPDDVWPRGDGHALIGEPGGPLSQKGYHEPGGSFTPSPGSFGVSVWVRDDADHLLVTSDTIPLGDIQERYVFRGDAKIPAIENVTPYYVATWSYAAPGHWQLELKKTGASRIEVVFRSVGPAGGPLESVIWDQDRLLLNRHWIATLDSAATSVVVGDESQGELQTAKPGQNSAASAAGWGFARLGLGAATVTVTLTAVKPQFASTLSYEKMGPQFEFSLPDKRFEDSLRAQVATLMAGYVGRQTGPGEPLNYPLAWERDGAYSLLAMGKSGQVQTAKELAVYFAEHDFFGGFGAEADAPGSATNALVELAYLFNEPTYFQWLWPHLVRKLALIDEMLNAQTKIYKEYVGPLAPHLLNDPRRHQQICEPAEASGLIVGSMDLHFPILYINAISYRGLTQAARLATTLGKTEQAAAWRAKAEKLREAWQQAFGGKRYENERNFMISVWPSWIVDAGFKPFVDELETRRTKEWEGGQLKNRPLWTYFNVAQAHQWLFLERPERMWETLEYFFAHQCAPGLYTYWEGAGEENTFKQWEHYRGWLKPRYVTPHYWTASEMLHLQLDALAYVDESKAEFEIVIGGGVPPAWLTHPLFLKSYRTKAGVVTWEYRDGELQVRVVGAAKHYAVRPGVSFREHNTKVTLSYD